MLEAALEVSSSLCFSRKGRIKGNGDFFYIFFGGGRGNDSEK